MTPRPRPRDTRRRRLTTPSLPASVGINPGRPNEDTTTRAVPQTLEHTLRAIVAEADAGGVRLDVTASATGLVLEEIYRGPDAPKGAGARVLARLCAAADDADLPIELVCIFRDEKLLALYDRHGFVVDEKNNDEDYDIAMIRKPRRASSI